MREEAGVAPGEHVERAVAAGTVLEGFAGACAAVLAILAILGTYPVTLTAIGVIALGGAIFLSAGGIAALLGRLRNRVRWGEYVAGGAGIEALIGAAAIAGAILVLANVIPLTLLPVSVIVLGSCVLMASGGLQFFMEGDKGGSDEATAAGMSGVENLIGLGVITLGVLALAGLYPPLFCEIAVLALGLVVLAKCMSFSAHMGARLAGS